MLACERSKCEERRGSGKVRGGKERGRQKRREETQKNPSKMVKIKQSTFSLVYTKYYPTSVIQTI